jgi:O-methyltransferase involved in polyketide biosynthesis
MAGLVYFEDRTDAATYLADHGWRTATVTTTNLLAQHGLPPIDADDAPFGEVLFVSAELSAK